MFEEQSLSLSLLGAAIGVVIVTILYSNYTSNSSNSKNHRLNTASTKTSTSGIMSQAGRASGKYNLKYLKQILPNLYQTPIEYPFGKQSGIITHAYIIQRENPKDSSKYENFMIYGTCHMELIKDDIEKLGGLSRIYINHRDEASQYHKIGYQLFNAPSYCHKNELSIIKDKTGLVVNESLFGFDYEKHKIHKEFDDFDIIPLPGHCDGATFYRYKYYTFSDDKKDNNNNNGDDGDDEMKHDEQENNNNCSYYLFSGDSVYFGDGGRDKDWKHGPTRFHSYKNQIKDFENSLQMLKENIQFDYLIPGLHGSKCEKNNQCFGIFKDKKFKNITFQSMIAKL